MNNAEALEADLRIERDGDKFIVRSRNMQQTGGSLTIGIGCVLGFFSIWPIPFYDEPLPEPLSYLVAICFILMGVYGILPHRVTTIFDMQSRQVRQTLSIRDRWLKRTQVYSFTDIASVGFDKFQTDDGPAYSSVVRLNNGTVLKLEAPYGNNNDIDAMEAIVAATGLQRKDELL
jgi:hypothetical protein